MRKTLILIVMALVLAGAVFAGGSADFLSSNFHYQEISFTDIIHSILNFFRGGITGLVGFSGNANGNLTIWDDTDTLTRYIDQQVYFFANFTNSTAVFNDSIASASICINFTEPVCGNMIFNYTSKLWEFNTSPFFIGTFNWSVNATSIVDNLAANDTVTVSSACLNVSKLSGDYFIKTNRTLCSGSQATNYSIFFKNVQSMELDCNNAVLRGGFPSDEPKPVIFIENGSQIYIHDCNFFNSSGSDIRANSSVGLRLENIVSNLNNASDSTFIFINANLTTINNIKVFNSKAVFGVGFGDISNLNRKFFNNTITNLQIENVSSPIFENLSTNFSSNLSIIDQLVSGLSGVGFGAINQVGLTAKNLSIKNIMGVCIGEGNSNLSVYSGINLNGCSNIGFGSISLLESGSKKITFENASIYNSGFAIASGNIASDASKDPSSSIKNISIYNSTYVLAEAFEDTSQFYLFSNINAYNSSTAFFAQDSKANVKDSYFDLSQSVNLQNSTVSFLNVTYDKSVPSSIDDNSLFRVGWLFNVFAADPILSPISGLNVTLYNTSGAIFSELTNSSGNIGWKNLTEFEENSSGQNFQNYINLTASAGQFLRQTLFPQINQSQVFQITMFGNGSIFVLSPVNGAYYKNPTINLTYVVLYNNTDRCWFINTTGGRINLSGCINTTFSSHEGLNNISVFANSTAGNLTFSKILFTLDTIVQNITSFSITNITNTSVLLSWSASEDVNMSFRYGDTRAINSGSGGNSTFNSQNSYVLSGFSVNTQYFINTTFCDRAGNCVINSTIFTSGRGNFTPSSIHIPEAEIIVQELVASELTATPQKTTLNPGSRYIFTLDSERHSVKLDLVYGEERALFDFQSDPIQKEVAKGSTVGVDLDNDGTDDISITVDDIVLTKVTFELKRISFKAPAVVPAETQPQPEQPSFVAPNVSAPPTQQEKTFIEKYGMYILISVVAFIAIVAGGGALLLQRRKPVAQILETKKILPVPKTSHLESLMQTVNGMLKDNKADLDVSKYLAEMNLEDNIIKSIVFEMKNKDNRIAEVISFTKKAFSQGKSVEEVREILDKNGWARNIVKLATEE